MSQLAALQLLSRCPDGFRMVDKGFPAALFPLLGTGDASRSRDRVRAGAGGSGE